MDYVHRVGGSLRLFLVGPVRNGPTYCQGQQYRVVLKKETRTRRQQVVGGVRFTSSERIVHAGKFSRDVHQKIGQS